MAATVFEVMNHEVFSVLPGADAAQTLEQIMQLGVTAAPVVDEGGAVVGMVSMRDLVQTASGATVGDRMSAPAVSLRPETLIVDAAREMTGAEMHHMPVIDDQGRAVGFVSSVDLLRAVIGEPVRHPPSFPHYDPVEGLVWSDPRALTEEELDHAPEGPGRLQLLEGTAGQPEVILWVESPPNVRARLHAILGGARNLPRSVEYALDAGTLRFRAAPVAPRRP